MKKDSQKQKKHYNIMEKTQKNFCVLHFDKVKGKESKEVTNHIERTFIPGNADPNRTHLNREMVNFPDGVTNRDQAIAHRLATAGLKRKIRADQVTAVRTILSGTHVLMKDLEANGRLDEWCEDSIQWLRDTFGADNVVSAVLHMDELTPHIHATIIPIVTGERRKAAYDADMSKRLGRKQYRKKALTARLCADDLFEKHNLCDYHTDYAKAMKKYGLERGVMGAESVHRKTAEWYKEQEQEFAERQQENIALQEENKRLCHENKELSITKAVKGVAVAAGDKIVGRLNGDKKQIKEQQATIEQQGEELKRAKQQISTLTDENKKNFETITKLQATATQAQRAYNNIRDRVPRILREYQEIGLHLRWSQIFDLADGKVLKVDSVTIKGKTTDEKPHTLRWLNNTIEIMNRFKNWQSIKAWLLEFFQPAHTQQQQPKKGLWM